MQSTPPVVCISGGVLPDEPSEEGVRLSRTGNLNLTTWTGETKTRQPKLTGVKLWEGTVTSLGCTHKLTRRRTCWQLSQADT